MFVDFAATREQCFTVFLRIQKVFVKDTSWLSKTLVVTQHMQKIETLHSALSLFYTPLTIHWWNHVRTVVIKKVSWSTSCFQALRYSVWYCLHVCIQCCPGPQTISPSEATTSDCIIDQLNTSRSCRGITSAPLVQIHNGVHWQNIRGNTAAEKLYSELSFSSCIPDMDLIFPGLSLGLILFDSVSVLVSFDKLGQFESL